MKDNTILVVVCVNNEELFEQCERQIRNIFVPPGYVVQIFPIRDAKSMASAYNRALSYSAKYKVYIHQDTYLINRDMFYTLIALFKENEKLGLIGVAGAQFLPSNGIWWEGENLVGKVIEYRRQNYQLLNLGQDFYGDKPFMSVQAVDGLLMATQYDLPWREDLFQGFHFYDVSQSLEFQKAGYLIGIPNQENLWCIHYSGDEFDADTYEKYRKVFVEHYKDILSPS
ncbi:glycosyltransferase family protein [Bacillus mycoides]|uniref:glycosyltransferase family protein n=1 Tax=Bacillus mycoides TaxID=1405 RepID=UPI003D2195A7